MGGGGGPYGGDGGGSGGSGGSGWGLSKSIPSQFQIVRADTGGSGLGTENTVHCERAHSYPCPECAHCAGVCVEEMGFAARDKVKCQWMRFLEPLGGDTFFTITFDDRKGGFARGANQACNRGVQLLGGVARKWGRPIPGFVVAEQHENGSYHVHGLLRLGGRSEEELGHMRSMLWRAAFDTYGRSEFRAIGDVEGVRGYVSKYLLKEVAEFRITSPRRWRQRGKDKSGRVLEKIVGGAERSDPTGASGAEPTQQRGRVQEVGESGGGSPAARQLSLIL